MPVMKSQSEVMNELGKRVEEAISRITERVLKIFREEYILKIVYTDNVKMYERTMDFLDAWDWTPIKREIARVSTELWYNPGKMSYDIDKFQHGSKYSTPKVVTETLMDILNKKGYSSSLWLSVWRDEAYWDKFMQDMFSGGQLEKIVNQEFTASGFKRI